MAIQSIRQGNSTMIILFSRLTGRIRLIYTTGKCYATPCAWREQTYLPTEVNEMGDYADAIQQN